MHFEGRKRMSMALDMAPLIDVVFLLLIFFMLTSTMTAPEALDLALPSSSSSAPQEDAQTQISLNKSGLIIFRENEVSLEELRSSLSELFSRDSEGAILIRTDKQVSIQRVIEVMDQVRLAGGTKLDIQTQAEQ